MKQDDLKSIYNEMINMITDSMNSADETITMIPQIGTIHTKAKAPYMSVDPRNGKPVLVDVSRRVHVRVKPAFKKIANEDYIQK